MKTLIVYYTRTNFTKKIAEELAQKLGADLEELIDLKNRQGAFGFVIAGKDATTKKLTEIMPINKNLRDYDLVIIGTPVWAGTMSAAMRTFLVHHQDSLKKIACFATQGGKNEQKVFGEIDKIINEKLLAKTFFVTAEIAQNKCAEKIEEFVRVVQNLK